MSTVDIALELADLPHVPVTALEPFQGNLKELSDREYHKLKKSLEENGVIVPFFVWQETGKLLDGHQRQRVFMREGWHVDVPVVYISAENVQDAKRKLLVISSQYGKVTQDGWDEFTFDLDEDWLTETAHFDALPFVFGDFVPEPSLPDSQDAEPQTDRAEELRKAWGVETGQLWRLPSRTPGQEHRLICGDCTDAAVVKRVMGGELARTVLTDAPYGQNQAGVTNDEPEKHKALIEGCLATMPCDKDCVIVGFQSPRTFPAWLDALRANGQKFERMLWMYKAAQMTYPWRGWLLTSEAILVSSLGAPDWNDVSPNAHDCYYLSEVSGELGENSGWHGSVKPLSVVSDLLDRVSFEAGIVYDPFLGSGTTIIAAENLSRQCRAVEISPAYVAVALQRYQDAFGITPELINVES